MVKIRISEQGSSIEQVQISGHANAGPYGADLVCCAVSAIAISACNALDELFPGACAIEVDENIRIAVVHDSEALQTALHMLKVQLESVVESNPDFVRLCVA